MKSHSIPLISPIICHQIPLDSIMVLISFRFDSSLSCSCSSCCCTCWLWLIVVDGQSMAGDSCCALMFVHCCSMLFVFFYLCLYLPLNCCCSVDLYDILQVPRFPFFRTAYVCCWLRCSAVVFFVSCCLCWLFYYCHYHFFVINHFSQSAFSFCWLWFCWLGWLWWLGWCCDCGCCGGSCDCCACRGCGFGYCWWRWWF